MQCFSYPNYLFLAISVCLFPLAYLLYRICLYSFRKMFSNDGIWRKLVESIRYPVLLILYLIALVIASNILELPDILEGIVEHGIVIFMILAIGWTLGATVRAFYLNFLKKTGDGVSADYGKRSMLTQVLFFYRLLIFVIVILTIASILITFPYIKSVGVGLLGSAGIAGLALGVAARPILLNLMAGFQIALTKTIKIGDAVNIEGECARIEGLHLTHVVARTWDLRRIILPISYFIDKPFQNWDTQDPQLLGSVFIHCDYTVPVDSIRKCVKELVEKHPELKTVMWKVQVSDCREASIELRILTQVKDAQIAYDQRAFLREKVLDFLQKEFPHSLPCVRYKQV